MDEELKQHLQRIEERLERCATKADLEAVETKLLSGFYDWARPVDIRLRTLPMIEERLGLLEERISKMERGDKPGGVH
jgi:hypothetical protein